MEVAEARQVFEAGRTSTGARLWQQATALRDQALHQDVAIAAEEGGVEANEAMIVLVAADEALARHDYATASGHYENVYNGSASGVRATAALGIAERNADADLRARIDKLRATTDREIEAAAPVAELLAS